MGMQWDPNYVINVPEEFFDRLWEEVMFWCNNPDRKYTVGGDGGIVIKTENNESPKRKIVLEFPSLVFRYEEFPPKEEQSNT